MDTPEFNTSHEKRRHSIKLIADGRLQDLVRLLQTERQWAAHYVWYVEKVLVGEHNALTEADHKRRRTIESTVPPARLAEWSELADDPHEAEWLFAWLQGRLDFAEFMLESIDWRLGNTVNDSGA